MNNITALLIGRVGDLVVATPMLRALRTRFPQARIRLVISDGCGELAKLIPSVDESLALHKLRSLSSLAANAKFISGLAAQPCDLLVDLNPSFSRTAAAIARFIRAPAKASFKRGRGDAIFTLQAEAAGEREHMLDRYARLAEVLKAPFEPKTELRLRQSDIEAADKILAALPPKKGRRVLIHPGNFKKYDNRWPEEKFVELTNRLLKQPGLEIFYMAGPGELEPVRGIVSRLNRPVPILPPSPLGVAGALMKRADLVVLNITGTTHVAAALDVPTFGFYSGYTDAVWRPRGAMHGGIVSESWESCRNIDIDEAYSTLKNIL